MIEFENKDDRLDYLFDQIDENDSITILADYETAKEFNEVFQDDEDVFEWHSITLDNQINEYFIEKYTNQCFSIEPAKISKGYLQGESDKLIILEELMNNEILRKQDCEELEIVGIEEDYNDSDLDDCTSEDCGDCCCCQCREENNLNEFEPYIEMGEKISEYVELIESNDKDSKVIKQAFVEFASWILDNFEDDEDELKIDFNPTYNISIDKVEVDNVEDFVRQMKAYSQTHE